MFRNIIINIKTAILILTLAITFVDIIFINEQYGLVATLLLVLLLLVLWILVIVLYKLNIEKIALIIVSLFCLIVFFLTFNLKSQAENSAVLAYLLLVIFVVKNFKKINK